MGIIESFDLPLNLNDALPGSNSEPLFIDMPLDHFANSTDDGVTTFQNRYWINATYYEPGGPVFIFDSGEQDAAPLVPYYLQVGLSVILELSQTAAEVVHPKSPFLLPS
ncbi:uncharacterized protein C8R40DRAFT_1178208 [Lentinula edodes]|uniref:uncharacterized protein n=1 Tax=Lentinula edodes TaxID=5353 RepID=UPI001E8CD92E|nr:uncharacterized protein C8R40DRAFT_1178208 [Lentinula edodes]KAH7868097.1 hypothetical protein C8R40DRAFT_1178208 [Lentinula edodes]KAJ3911948.1 hypothetical protein F5877DRAFT_85353 [Lentinula edodes]